LLFAAIGTSRISEADQSAKALSLLTWELIGSKTRQATWLPARGDVAFDDDFKKGEGDYTRASGVGPMTIAMLMANNS